VRARDIETSRKQRLYVDPIIAYRQSDYQEIVMTRRGADMRLYLDAGSQFSTRDGYGYRKPRLPRARRRGAIDHRHENAGAAGIVDADRVAGVLGLADRPIRRGERISRGLSL
jgi:hypothetical protein